jgi:hypothetical protein
VAAKGLPKQTIEKDHLSAAKVGLVFLINYPSGITTGNP